MPPRPKARQNAIVDVLVEMLEEIGAARDLYTGPVPQFIGRIFDVAAATCDLPAILLQVPEEEVENVFATGAGLRHESWLHVWVNVVTANPDQPDTDLIELCSDVKRCFLEQATGRLINRVGMTGEVAYEGMKSHVQIATVTGKAAARLYFRVWYKWSHDAP